LGSRLTRDVVVGYGAAAFDIVSLRSVERFISFRIVLWIRILQDDIPSM
jgi:hypothetical protein